jgi:hypothetical protein
VKLQDKKKVVNVPIPDTKNFFHKIIIEVARNLYADPYLIETRKKFITSSEINKNTKKIYKIIDDSVDKTIRLLLPMEEILTVYLEPDAEGEGENEIEEEPENEIEEEPEVEQDPIQYTELPVVEPQILFNNPPPIENLFDKEPIPTYSQNPFNEEPEYKEPTPIPNVSSNDEPIKVQLKDNDKQNFFSDDESEGSVTEI